MGNLRSGSRGRVLVGFLGVMWRVVTLVILGLMIWHQSAHAETIPAETATVGEYTGLSQCSNNQPRLSCSPTVPACYTAGTGKYTIYKYNAGTLAGWVYVSGCEEGGKGVYNKIFTYTTLYKCPATGGWTLSGSTCTRPDCGPSETRQADGTCKSNCVAGTTSTAARYIGMFSSGVAGVAYGTHTPPPATLCDGSCAGVPERTTSCTSRQLAAGTPIQCTYEITLNGSACSGGNGVPPTYDPCYGQGKQSGTVSGVIVCSGNAPTTYSGGKSNPGTDGTPGDGGKETETSCDAEGKCTTTETETAPDGTKTTETTQADKGTFCQENPNSPICKFTSFSGSCGAVPACDGDAIQCAQARDAFLTRCALTSDDNTMANLGNQVTTGNDPVKSPSDASQVSEINLPTSFDTTETYGASCPAPVSITLNGVTKSIAFDTYCQWAEILGRIGVALAMIGGAMICFGSVKG